MYAPDLELQNAANAYVNNVHDGVIRRAATALKLDYIMLRRFLATGRAKPENRQKVRNALDANEAGVARDRKVAHDIPIDVTRSVLTQLLDALDAYQAGSTSQGAGR